MKKSKGKKSTKSAVAELTKASKKAKSTTKKSRKAKSNGVSADATFTAEQRAYAAKLKKEYGNVTAMRAVSQKYKKLRRRDVIAIGVDLGIPLRTASTQFWVSRSGQVQLELDSL